MGQEENSMVFDQRLRKIAIHPNENSCLWQLESKKER